MFVPILGQEKKYEVKKRRVLKGKCVPEYAAVRPQGKGLMLASQEPFICTHVDGCPVEQPDPEPMEEEQTGGFRGAHTKECVHIKHRPPPTGTEFHCPLSSWVRVRFGS